MLVDIQWKEKKVLLYAQHNPREWVVVTLMAGT